MRTFKQGYYKPRNPQKYVGDVRKIRYMSSWELRLHQFLDNNPSILQWSSESIAIPYIKPTDKRKHYYYPDYWIKYQNKDGQTLQEIIEVKPAVQTQLPTARGKSRKQQIVESVQYAINIAKWSAAKQFCDKYGIRFRILTEQELFR